MALKSKPTAARLAPRPASMIGAAALALLVLSCAEQRERESAAPSPIPVAPAPPAVPSAEAAATKISHLSLRPKRFVPGDRKQLEIGFDIDGPGRVSVSLANDEGAPIRQFALGEQPAGRVTAGWDGLDEAGRPVASAVYFVGIEVAGAAGSLASYGPAPEGGGDEILAQRFTIDGKTGKVSYLLPRASWVRLRAGLDGLPHLVTPVDWRPQAAGRHEMVWDGLDASGLLQFREHPNLRLSLDAFELPRNAVILESPEAPAGRGGGTVRRRGPRYRHARHRPAQCHEPRLELSFPSALERDPDGRPILSGEETVRITVHPADVAHMVNTRFEVMYFIDTVYYFEEEEGTSPFSYQLDVTQLAPGLHFMTVNLLSVDDHAGVATVPFVVAQIEGLDNGGGSDMSSGANDENLEDEDQAEE